MSCPSGMPAISQPIGKDIRNIARRIRSHELPRMMGFQAAGAAPIVLGRIVDQPQTVATAIRIGNPASWSSALSAIEESAGAIDMVTDEEILQAYTMVAATEGVFCEPASAASVAGVDKLHRTKHSTGGRDSCMHAYRAWIKGCRYGDRRVETTKNRQSDARRRCSSIERLKAVWIS